MDKNFAERLNYLRFCYLISKRTCTGGKLMSNHSNRVIKITKTAVFRNEHPLKFCKISWAYIYF